MFSRRVGTRREEGVNGVLALMVGGYFFPILTVDGYFRAFHGYLGKI